MVIPIMIDALGTIPKSLIKRLEELEIEGRAKTIQTTAFLRSATTLKESGRREETCYLSDSCKTPSANLGV